MGEDTLILLQLVKEYKEGCNVITADLPCHPSTTTTTNFILTYNL